MKRNVLFVIVYLLGFTAFSQTQTFFIPDSIPNCEMIKSGTFVNIQSNNVELPDYSIVYDGGYVTELISNGEFYLKSQIIFTSDCAYTSNVIEVTIPNYDMGVGTVINTEIIATDTSHKLLRIKSTYAGKDFYFMLKKIKE